MAKYCSDCGTKINEEDKFCGGCGKEFGAKEEKENDEDFEVLDSNTRQLPVIGGIILACTGGLGMLISMVLFTHALFDINWIGY